METPVPTTAEQAPTILIVAEDEVQTVKSEPGVETHIRVFADTDALRALQCISRDRPRVVMLGRAFVDSPRGAALVNAIRSDRTLANTQIRVISRASDYVGLVRRTEPQAALDDAKPGEPLPADFLGTRGATVTRCDQTSRCGSIGTRHRSSSCPGLAHCWWDRLCYD